MQALPKTLPAFIWHFSRPYFWPFLVFFMAPMLLILEATVVPYSLKMIVDTVANYGGSRDTIFSVLAPALWLGGGAWVFMVVFFRLQEWWQCYIHPKFEADIRMAMFAYTRQHSHQYFASNFAGSLSNKISDMVNAVRNILMMLRWNFVSTISVTLAALALMATISPIFSLVLGGWTCLHIGLVYLFARRANRVSVENAEDRSTLAGKVVDAFSNMMNVRLFSHRQYEDDYLSVYQDKEKHSYKRMLLVMSNAKIATEIPTFLLFCTMFYLLISGWRDGEVTSGDFVFIFYTSFNVIHHVWFLSMELPNFFREIGVARQALSIITPPHGVEDAEDAKALEVTQGEIAFESVRFSYRAGKNIFCDKSITIEAGQKVGLVGFSGSGKSTFVNLILRFYDVENGRILIDGQDIARVTQESLRGNIAMIPQDTSLFHRTLMENIRYGRLDASDSEVIEASKQAYCHEFIEEIPGKYDALVGERGVKLSGGQRQRIAFARALLKNAPILILDEATSSLDSLTERCIQESLERLMHGRTTIVIAHRLSTLSDMDRILVFKEGDIIEDGNHEALLAQKGHYAELWNMQVGGFLPDEQ